MTIFSTLISALLFSQVLSAQDSATCVFDTAAHTENRTVNVALVPAWGPAQPAQARDDYLLAAQAIAQYFRPPTQVHLPFWARTVGLYRDESGRHPVGIGLRGYVRFHLNPIGRLADSAISVDFASSELADAFVNAIKRADSAQAFSPPSNAVVHDHGIIRLRVLAPPDTQRSISLFALTIPVVIVDSAPEVISFPSLSYPDVLRENRLSGNVLVRVVVLENGRVDPTSLDLVRAPYREFAVEALHGIEGARFRPARVESCSVPTSVILPVEFKIKNRSN